MEFSNKRVLVIGLGRSGKAASLKLHNLGAEVLASDISTSNEMKGLADELRESGITVKLGKQEKEILGGIDMVVVSPGVPSRVPVTEVARAAGLPVWSEIELAYRLTDKPIIAITGTNGKTTTTTLIGKIFEAAGRRTAVAGNIGTPLVSAVDDPDIAALIVEVSSFQLDAIVDFKPSVSVLLNITEDHLDWHPNFEDYIRAKSRIFINQGTEDFAILNMDDDVVRSIAPGIRSSIMGTSKKEIGKGICVKDDLIVASLDDEIEVCRTNELKIIGAHNLDNAMAAIGACLASGINIEAIRKALTSFPGLSHRIEYVASVNGVDYYNDSKATNVDATSKAMMAFEKPIILLVGGRNKGNSFKPLAQGIDERIKAIVGFGEAGREILDAIDEDTLREYVETVDDAVALANKIAQPGQVVLFSPSCASFDAFNSYKHRGEVFKRAVLALGEKDG